MKEADKFKDQIARLEQALQSGALPDRLESLARECIARSQRKLRVAVVGSNVFSTTNVANFFLGQKLLPGTVGHDVPARIAYGTPGKVTCKTEDGSVETHALDDAERVFADDPLSVSIAAPFAPLQRFTLMRIGMEEDAFANGTSSLLASSDVVFWCSDTFEEEEKAYWSDVPARVSDHGYLVVSKGAALENPHRQLFRRVIEADVPQAEALREVTPLDREAFEDCGGAALLSAMRNEIATAERELADAVSVVLTRLGDTAPDMPLPDVTTTDDASETPEAVEAKPEDAENPWIGKDFLVSRVRGSVTPRRVERTTSSPRPPSAPENIDPAEPQMSSDAEAEAPDHQADDTHEDILGADIDAETTEDTVPVNLAEVVPLVSSPAPQGNRNEAPPPADDAEPLDPSEELRRFLSASLSNARRPQATSESDAKDGSVEGMISRLLEDASEMLADREQPSDFVLDWVEDKLSTARDLVANSAEATPERLTDSIDDALEAVSVLRFEEEAETVREDALRMALQVGRELQSKLAG